MPEQAKLITGHTDRERKLVESEEKFAKVFKNNIVGMAIAGLDSFKFIEANSAFAELIGHSASEIIGRTPLQLKLFKRREDALNLANMLEEGIDINNVHLDIITKSGAVCTALFSASCVSIGGKPCVLFSAVDRTRHAQSENALRQSEQTLRLLTRKLISLQEEERASLSRVLHDDLAQILTALSLELELLLNDSETNREETERILNITSTAIASLRQICAGLRPHTLDDLGLFSALNILIDKFTETSGIPVARKIERSDSCEHCRRVHLPIFRVAQEALANIAKHSKASNVTILFKRADANAGGCVLAISDDGIGFNPSELSHGLGIIAMKERAADCGGKLGILSEPGKGTEIRMTIYCDSIEPGGGGI